MAPEPKHLVGIAKQCRHCSSPDVKFAYNNNGKETQPRYSCRSCGNLFPLFGKLRAVKPPRIQPNADRRSPITAHTPEEAPVGKRRSARIAPGPEAKPEPVELLQENRPSSASGASPTAVCSAESEAILHSKEADPHSKEADSHSKEADGADCEMWVKAVLGIPPYDVVPASKAPLQLTTEHEESLSFEESVLIPNLFVARYGDLVNFGSF